MVVADTSIWIDYFRGKNAALAARLDTLIDEDSVAIAAPIRVELFAGAKRQDLAALRRVLGALPLLPAPDSAWAQVEEWALFAATRQRRFGVVDLLIAAIARENDCRLWSLDADFSGMKKLGFVTLYEAIPS